MGFVWENSTMYYRLAADHPIEELEKCARVLDDCYARHEQVKAAFERVSLTRALLTHGVLVRF